MARKENGEYLLLSKFDEEVVFEYHITIRDEDFNLGILTMRTPEGVVILFSHVLKILKDYVYNKMDMGSTFVSFSSLFKITKNY